MATAASTLRAGDVIGSQLAAIHKQLGNKEFTKFLAELRRRGISASQFQPGVPLGLQARTQHSIKTEAARTIRTAYAPVEQELSQQEARIKALSDRRAADNRYYHDWLQQNQAKSNEAALAGASAAEARQDQMRSSTEAFESQSEALLRQNANARRDSTQDQSGSTALNTSPEREYTHQLLAAEASRSQFATDKVRGGNAFATALNTGYIAAEQARQTSESLRALAEVGDKKTRLALEKAAKQAELVAQLIDKEGAKAEANRQYGLAQTTLDQKSTLETLKETGRNSRNAATIKGANDRAALDREATLAIANDKSFLTRAAFKTKYGGLTPEAAAAMSPAKLLAYLRKNKLGAYSRAGGTNVNVGGLTPNQITNNKQKGQSFIRKVDTAYAQAASIVARKPRSEEALVLALVQGLGIDADVARIAANRALNHGKVRGGAHSTAFQSLQAFGLPIPPAWR